MNFFNLKGNSQLNAVTHFLDLDFIYVPDTVKDAIRNNGKFLDSDSKIHHTVILGDERSAQFPQYFAIAVVWIRFHNVVVDELERLHPNLSPSVKFHEARRFVIAVYQNILYAEVIPLIVSGRSIERYRLESRKPCYDPNIDPSVTAEFTASAFRYLHTYMQNGYVVNHKNDEAEVIALRNLTDETLALRELAGVITGLTDRPWNTLDIAEEVGSNVE